MTSTTRAADGTSVCPICGTPSARRGPRRFLLCSDCDLLFAADMRAGDADWYGRTWIYTRRPAATPPSLAAIESNWAWDAFLRELPVSKGTLLDVGCGQGDLLYAARLRGLEVEGVDFQPELVRIARECYGLNASCRDIWEMIEDRRRFDVVTAFEVVEHVERPVEFLRALGSIGRYVAVSVPCAERQPAFFARGFDDPPHHLTIWTPAALQRAFDLAGLRTVTLRGDSYQPVHFGAYLGSLFGGNYPFGRHVRGAMRRLGTALGRFVRPRREGAFTLLAVAEGNAAVGQAGEEAA